MSTLDDKLAEVLGRTPADSRLFIEYIPTTIRRIKQVFKDAGYVKRRTIPEIDREPDNWPEPTNVGVMCATGCPNTGKYLHSDGKRYCFAHYAALRHVNR